MKSEIIRRTDAEAPAEPNSEFVDVLRFMGALLPAMMLSLGYPDIGARGRYGYYKRYFISAKCSAVFR